MASFGDAASLLSDAKSKNDGAPITVGGMKPEVKSASQENKEVSCESSHCQTEEVHKVNIDGADQPETVVTTEQAAEGCMLKKVDKSFESQEKSHCARKDADADNDITDEEKAWRRVEENGTPPASYCRCDQRLLIEFVCRDDGDAFCSYCKSVYHRECKTVLIIDIGRKFSKNTVKSTYNRMKAIGAKFGQLYNQQQENIKTFASMTENSREKIRIMRENLHSFVDKIADASLLELRSCALKHTNDMDSISAKVAKINEQVIIEKDILQSAISSLELYQMSQADMVGTHKCYFFQRAILDIENNTKPFEISFEEDKVICNIMDKIIKVGTVMVNREKCVPGVVSIDLIAMSPVENKATVRLCPKDAERMTGSTFMPSGDLLICDRNASLVRLFDPAFTEVSKMRLPSNPWDVATVKSTKALISMPYVMKLQFIETRPCIRVKTKQCITLDSKCFGVAVVDDRIVVSCSDGPGNGEIRILDMFGNLKKKLGVCEDGTTELVNPLYILYVRESNTIIASEYGKREIVCLTKGGNIQFRYTVPGGGLRGMIVDKDENIFVCDENKNCIYVITDSGSNHKTFLEIASTDGERPTSVCYRSSDGTLIVTCWKTILVYKLK